jgi:hypothetical protein
MRYSISLSPESDSLELLPLRVLTFLITSVCLSLPTLKFFQEAFGIKKRTSIVLVSILFFVFPKECLYMFNWGYSLFFPVMLLIVYMFTSEYVSRSIMHEARLCLLYFFLFLILINKSLVAFVSLVTIVLLFGLNFSLLKLGRLNFSPGRVAGSFLAIGIHLALSESERAANGYSVANLLYFITGIFFAAGIIVFPISGIALDELGRRFDWDLLTGAGKLITFSGGVLVICYLFKVNRWRVRLPGRGFGFLAVLMSTFVVFCSTLASLNFSQYSSWYLGGWFFTPATNLVNRHFFIASSSFLLFIFCSISRDWDELSISRYKVNNMVKLQSIRQSFPYLILAQYIALEFL